LRTAAAPSASPAAVPAAALAKATPLGAGRVASTGQSSLQLFMFGHASTNESTNQVNDYLSTSSVAPVEGSRSAKCGSLALLSRLGSARPTFASAPRGISSCPDAGATADMCQFRDSFDDYTPLPSLSYITMANGAPYAVLSYLSF
jgi:hypothetical protein